MDEVQVQRSSHTNTMHYMRYKMYDEGRNVTNDRVTCYKNYLRCLSAVVQMLANYTTG